MTPKLNVTTGAGTPWPQAKWVGYVVENNRAQPTICGDTIEEMRNQAKSLGFDGILIGSPSVPWSK